MPREILINKNCQAEIRLYPEESPNVGQVRIQVEYAAPKHGTERHVLVNDEFTTGDVFNDEYQLFLAGEAGSGAQVFRPGNMWVGKITELGPGVSDFETGQRVAGYGPIRETMTYSAERLLRLHDKMSWQQAVCYDPCQFALGGIRDSQLRIGDVCCVLGLGAIGQMAAQMARLAGARLVVVSDPIENRRKAALQNGADVALNPLTDDVGFELKKLSGKLGADAIIETSGSYQSLQQALRGIAYGGRIAVVGWYNRVTTGALDLGREAHFNNATLFFSRVCSEPNPDYPRWSWKRINDTCWNMLTDGKLHCENIIHPVVPFEKAGEAYLDCVINHPEKSIKMGVAL